MLIQLKKAKENEEFLSLVEKFAPDNYYDWKITIAFYCALHYLRALEHLKKTWIEHNHQAFNHHLNPDNADAIMPIDKLCFECYISLYYLSRTSRYEYFKESQLQSQLNISNLKAAKGYLKTIKKYCTDCGVKEK